MQQTIRLEGHITPEQARQSPYVYLPFKVPARVQRIDIAYGYSDPVTAPMGLGAGNSLDIGLFDSRGHDFIQAPGFRGWSGTAKKEFFVSASEATPGYIRGPLIPGEWNVLLGVARIGPSGLRYSVDVKLDIAYGPLTALPPAEGGAAVAEALPRVLAEPSPGPRWVKGDLHCHTLHSDGLNTVEELVINAVGLGLDFLAVTDHNTITHHEDLDRLAHYPITLIPGEEVTTYWGHANTWGLREWIEFRCADEESIRSVLQYVQQKGAMLSINHPKCIGPPWFFKGWEGYASMEVWQAPWRFYNWESLERWDTLLRAGEHVVAVGGSDVHSIPPAEPRHPHGLANPTTWVYVEDGPSERAVLDGIRKGHVFISDAPNGSHLMLSADADGDGRFETMLGDTIEADGPIAFRVQVHGGMDRRLWVLTDGLPVRIVALSDVESTFDFTLDVSDHKYVRADLRGFRGRPERGEVVWAMTNPIWVQH